MYHVTIDQLIQILHMNLKRRNYTNLTLELTKYLLDKNVKEDDQLKPQLLYCVNKISNERNPQTRTKHSLHIKFHFLIFSHFLIFLNNI
jgi:hypothetical protein